MLRSVGNADSPRLEIETMDESWLAVVKDELTKPYFLDVWRLRKWICQP